MPALDYAFAHRGLILRLVGKIRSGWTTQAGRAPYFRGICTLSWKGAETRVDLSLTCPTGTTLATVESMSWRADDPAAATKCALTGGRGVASSLWARVREEAAHSEITASADTDDGKRRLAAWGFKEAHGMWTWRRSR